MKSIVPFVATAILAALILPTVLGNSKNTDAKVQNVSVAKTSPTGPATAQAFRDSRGHFSFRASMNGKSINVLVDTGASVVAINKSTAKRINLRSNGRTMRLSTANGTVFAQSATIKEIRIGDIAVYNVKAVILDDSALDGTLLGMSFLKKLRKFEMDGRTLTLVK